MKQVVKDNPDSYTKSNVSGRVKLIEYNDTTLKGSWELKTAQWLDSLNINWTNEVTPQKYFWNNDWHLYFPDFFLLDYSSHIEVKGYQTDRDNAKWSQFNGSLVIVNHTNVHQLSNYNSILEFIELFRYKV